MTTPTARVALVLVVTVASGCWNRPLTPDEAMTVDRFLVCYECDEPLERLLELAQRRPTATVDSLNRALVSGPPPAVVTETERALALAFARDSAWNVSHGLAPGEDREDYVTAGAAYYVHGYRAHGALGMGWIHTGRAVRHLDAALRLSLPPSVRAAVIYARDSLPPPQR